MPCLVVLYFLPLTLALSSGGEKGVIKVRSALLVVADVTHYWVLAAGVSEVFFLRAIMRPTNYSEHGQTTGWDKVPCGGATDMLYCTIVVSRGGSGGLKC